MSIKWDTEEESNSGIKWDDTSGDPMTLDSSQAALAQSQKLGDMLRQSEEANKQAKQASSLGGMVQETGKQTVNSLFGGAVKAGRSLVQGVGEMFGAKPDYEQTYNDFAGNPQKTLQGEVYAGEKSPLMGTGEFALNAASTIPIGKIASKATSLLAKPVAKAAEATSDVLSKALSPITKPIASYLTQRAEKKALDESIDAVYSSPTGKKFVNTSNQILSGERKITPASAFKEEGLTPDERTINLGTRLKDLKLGKDSVKNTQRLTQEMAITEKKIGEAFKNGGVEYLADKQGLIGKFDEVLKNAPEEFRIGDSPAKLKQVTDFAKRLVAKMPDSNQLSRTTRTEFDAQAKKEFPSAFKPDGSVDTKTPAGSAIKSIRDTWNKHIYDTAPNGSEIQNLIGREADIYKATKVALEKAQTAQGKKSLGKWAQENPEMASLLKAAGLVSIGSGGALIFTLGD